VLVFLVVLYIYSATIVFFFLFVQRFFLGGGGGGGENLLIAYILFSWYGERTVACITIIFSKVWDINTV